PLAARPPSSRRSAVVRLPHRLGLVAPPPRRNGTGRRRRRARRGPQRRSPLPRPHTDRVRSTSDSQRRITRNFRPRLRGNPVVITRRASRPVPLARLRRPYPHALLAGRRQYLARAPRARPVARHPLGAPCPPARRP